MNNSECIEVFKQYLANEKKASANTLSSYLRDIRQLGEYLEIHHDTEIMDAKEEELNREIFCIFLQYKQILTQHEEGRK